MDGRFKFILFCAEKGGKTEAFRCAFMEHDPERLPLIDAGALKMQLEAVRKFSPNTLSVMEFKSQRDIDIATKIYGDWPLLGEVREDSWNVKFTTEFHMTNDSHLFVARDKLEQMGAVEITGHRWVSSPTALPEKASLEMLGYDALRQMAEREEIELFLPLWEGKQIWILTDEMVPPSSWIRHGEVSSVSSTSFSKVVYRALAASTNERTLIGTTIPPGNPVGHSMNVCPIGPDSNMIIAALLTSFILDWLIRCKVTTNLTMFYLYQLPVPMVENFSKGKIHQSLISRTARLISTSTIYRDLWKSVFHEEYRNLDFWYPVMGTKYDHYGPKHEQDIRRRLAEEAANLTPEWTPACGVHD
ncbi:MAG: hypothetical protein WA133_07635, partial [Syntrophales bacterium]